MPVHGTAAANDVGAAVHPCISGGNAPGHIHPCALRCTVAVLSGLGRHVQTQRLQALGTRCPVVVLQLVLLGS